MISVRVSLVLEVDQEDQEEEQEEEEQDSLEAATFRMSSRKKIHHISKTRMLSN
jgi:hypothetical protein